MLLTLHVLVCLALIVVVLLQADRGEGLSGAFGGAGTHAIFGKRSSGGPLAKFTTAAAIIFMITSVTLAFQGHASAPGRSAAASSNEVPGSANASSSEVPGSAE